MLKKRAGEEGRVNKQRSQASHKRKKKREEKRVGPTRMGGSEKEDENGLIVDF